MGATGVDCRPAVEARSSSSAYKLSLVPILTALYRLLVIRLMAGCDSQRNDENDEGENPDQAAIHHPGLLRLGKLVDPVLEAAHLSPLFGSGHPPPLLVCQDQRSAAGEHAAGAVRHAHVHVRHLPLAALAAQLAHRLDDREHPVHPRVAV